MRLLLLLASLLAAPLAAQTSVPPANPLASDTAATLAAEHTLGAHALGDGSIDLDGRLDETAWAAADVATGFVQNRPEPGAPASEPTEARVLYDGGAVYVGLRMHDSQPERVQAPLGRRDADLEGDWVLVAFDSYHDRRTAFAFALNPAGVQQDLLLYDDVREDMSWDAVWSGAASRDAEGWTAEFRIPLSQLRYAGGRAVQDWGLQFHRKHHRTGERTFWAPMLPDDNGMVSLFGTLSGLRDLHTPRQLELMPYVASSLTRAPGNRLDPFYAQNDVSPRVGLDLKYGITSDLTLTATVNPDFGQVEADPARVNLGGFELSFDERRPFFVEGTDVFSMQPRRFFGMNRPSLLYTRRIGRSPQRTDFVPGAARQAAGDDGTVYTDAPQQSTILGAAKLSGRVGRFSVGVLDAVTGPEYGLFQAFDGAGQMVMDDRALVEPATNFTAARARGTFGRTIVGALGTSVFRSTANDVIASLLPTQATVLGVDVEHPVGDWIVNGQLAGSHVSGSTESIARLQTAFPRLYQRPDADYLDFDPTRTSISGLTGEVNVLKASGEHWVGGLHGEFTSPGFDANELGYQSRADEAGLGGVLVYQQNDPQGPFQNWSANVYSGARWNFGGDRMATFLGGSTDGQLRNFWGGSVSGEVWTRGTSDRTTRGGPLAAAPAGFSLNGNVWSDDRKPVSGYFWTGTNRNELGSWSHGVEIGMEARPTSSVQFSVGPGVDLSHDPRQFVGIFEAPGLEATFGNRYVFGAIDQTTLAMSARLNWTFTPTLSLQTYVRPFVSRGRYSDFRQMTAPGQLDFPLYGEGFGAVESGSFEEIDGEAVFVPGAGSTAYRVTGADGGQATFSDPSFTVRALQGNAVLRWEYRPGSALFLVWQQQRNGYAVDGRFEFDRDVRGLLTDPVTNVFLIKLSYWLG